MSMNLVVLTGRITKDIEIKYSQGGSAYCRFTLAVNRAFKKDETDFIFCTAFGKTSELIAEYLRKGSMCGVQGRLQQDTYEKDGQKISKTSVIVDKIEFLESKKEVESKKEYDDSDSDSFPF